MTQPTLDDEIDSGETCEEVAAMETGTLQFAIQKPSGAFTSIELAMKTLTNDLNCEYCFKKVLVAMEDSKLPWVTLEALASPVQVGKSPLKENFMIWLLY